MHVNDAHQVESVLIFVRTIHIAHAIAIVEDGLFNHLRNILTTHPSAVVALVRVVAVVHIVGSIFSSFKFGLSLLHELQSLLTVFQRRLDFEQNVLNVASFVSLIAVLVLLIESLVVGIGHSHGRIRDGGITQNDDIGRSLHVLVFIVFLGQRSGKEIGCLHQIVELGLQAVLFHGFFEIEPTVIILWRKVAEVLKVFGHALFVNIAVTITEALNHPLVRFVASNLVHQFLCGDADTCGLIFLGHDVILDHLFQSAVVDTISFGGREVVV